MMKLVVRLAAMAAVVSLTPGCAGLVVGYAAGEMVSNNARPAPPAKPQPPARLPDGDGWAASTQHP